MAKRSAGPDSAPAAAAAPAPAPTAATNTKALQLGTNLGAEPAVIEWDGGNGVSQFQAGTLPAGEAEAAAPAEGDKPDAEPDAAAADPAVAPAGAPDDAEAGAGDTKAKEGDAAEPPPAPRRLTPEQRRQALANLQAERARVSLETEARNQRERAERLEAEAQRPLLERVRGLSQAEREQLLDVLLVGGDAPAGEAAPAAKESPEVAALRQKVETLERDARTRQEAQVRETVDQALAGVAQDIKDVDVPVVHAVPEGYDLTLRIAHQAWLDARKTRPMREFLAGAAEVAEEHLRQQYPRIATLADARRAAAGGEPTPKPTAKPPVRAPATSIGKRTAARPDAAPTDLPLDRHLRDQAIKKEMGWAD